MTVKTNNSVSVWFNNKIKTESHSALFICILICNIGDYNWMTSDTLVSGGILTDLQFDGDKTSTDMKI